MSQMTYKDKYKLVKMCLGKKQERDEASLLS